ncbi:MAG: DUF6477 family protein [Pseudomonadota bacterium]
MKILEYNYQFVKNDCPQTKMFLIREQLGALRALLRGFRNGVCQPNSVNRMQHLVDKMPTPSAQLTRMSRPSMLVRAARFCAAATLRRRARTAETRPLAPFDKLIEEEARLNDARCTGDAGYSPTRHVEVLASLLAAAGYGALPHL